MSFRKAFLGQRGTPVPGPSVSDEERHLKVLARCPALAPLWSAESGARCLEERLASNLQRGLIPKNTRFNRLERKLIFIASGRARMEGASWDANAFLQAGSILHLEPLVTWVRGSSRARPLDGVALTDLEVLSLPPSSFLEVFGDEDGRGVLEHLLAIHDARERVHQIVRALAEEPRLANARSEHLYRLAESAVSVSTSVHGLLPERGGSPRDFYLLLEGTCRLDRGLGLGALRSAPACLGLLETLGVDVPFESVSAGSHGVFARISGAFFQQLRVSEPDFDRAIQRGSPDVILQPPREPVPHQFILLDGTETLKQQPHVEPSRFAPLLAERLAAHLHEHVMLVRMGPEAAIPAEPSDIHVPNPKGNGWWMEVGFALHANWHKPLATALARLAPDPWVRLPDSQEDAAEHPGGKKPRNAGDLNVTLLDVSRLSPQERDSVLEMLVRDLGRLRGPVKLAWLSEDPASCLPGELPEGIEVIPTGVLLPVNPGELFNPVSRRVLGRALMNRDKRSALLTPVLHSLRNWLERSADKPAWPVKTARIRIRPEWLVDGLPGTLASTPEPTEGQDSFDRWARALTGRRLGLALGGGGALAFVHVGLIQRMQATPGHPLPIDLVSGSSFGSVVGAFYCAAGDEGLRQLLRHRERMRWAVWLSFLDNVVMEWWTNLELKMKELQRLEIPFFPVVTDLGSGVEWDVRHGRIGLGVRASGSLPPAFSPTRIRGRRLIDGGVVANVPINVLRVEGADMIVASNPLPRATAYSQEVPPVWARWRLFSMAGRLAQQLPPFSRIADSIRAQELMVRTAGESQELGPYTVLFKPEYNPAHLTAFGAGEWVAREARESDDATRVALELEMLWRSRLNNPVSVIEVEGNTLKLLHPLSFAHDALELLPDRLLLFALIEKIQRQSGMQHATLKVTASTQKDAEHRARVLENYLSPFVAQALSSKPRADALLPKAHTRLQVELSNQEPQAEQLVVNGLVKAIENYRQFKERARLAETDVQLYRLLDAAEFQARSGDPELARLLALEAVKLARRTGAAALEHPAWQDRVLRAVLRGERLLVRKLDYLDPSKNPIPVRALAWSPDGRRVAIGGQSNTLQLHEVHGERQRLTSLQVGDEAGNSLLWTERRLIGSSTRGIHVFSHATSEQDPVPTHTLDPKTWDQWGLSSSPDGKWLLATHASVEPASSQEAPSARYTNVGLFCLEPQDPGKESLGFHVYAEKSWNPLLAWSKPPAFRARWNPVSWAPKEASREQRFAVAGVADTDDPPLGCVRIWRIVEGRPVVEHNLPLTQARSVAWHPGGERLAAGGAEGAVLWLPEGENRVVRLDTGGSPVDFVDWAPDGSRLATAGVMSPSVRIWSPEGVLLDVVCIPEKQLEGLAWGPPQTRGLLAIWHGLELTVWNALNREQYTRLTGHDGQVRHAAWSQTGWLATGGVDGTVRIWKLHSDAAPVRGLFEKHMRDRYPLWVEAFRRAGVQAAALDDGVLETPDPKAMMPERPEGWELPLDERRWVAFSPDRFHAVVARDNWELMLVSENAAPVQLAPAREMPDYLHPPRAVWSPDTRYVALWGTSEVRVWKVDGLRRGQLVGTLSNENEELVAIAWAPSGTRLALSWWHSGVSIWTADEASGGKVTHTDFENEVAWMSWSPCGTKLALACNASSTLRIHEVSKDGEHRLLHSLPHHSPPVRVAWNPRGGLLATGDKSGAVWIWNEQGEDLVESPQERLQEIRHLVWSPEGTNLLSVAADGRALIWGRTRKGWGIGSVLQEGNFPVRWAAFSQNEQWVGLMGDARVKGRLRLFPVDLDTLVRCVQRLPWRNTLTQDESNKYLKVGAQPGKPRQATFKGEPPFAH